MKEHSKVGRLEKRVRGLGNGRSHIEGSWKGFAVLASALAASLTLTAAPAIAQSSVTLYGVADDGIMFTSNQGGHTAVQAVQAGLYSSQWGLTGAEDLGGGLKAIFKLENGFNINSGALQASNTLFNRQAYVGLASPYGALRIGRQFDASFDTLGTISAGGKFDGGLASQVGDLNNVFGDFNIQNAVKYLSPLFGGFKLELLYGFGNVAGNFSQDSTVNAALSYQNGPLVLAATYLNVKNPAVAVWSAAAAPVAGKPFANPLLSPIFSGYASAEHLQISGAGANLAVGPGSIGVIYTNTQLQNVVRTNTTPFSGTAIFNDLQLNYAVYITPAWQTGVGFNYTWAPDAKYEQAMLGTTYNLSKSTILYITSAYQHAHGVNSLGESAVAVNSNVPASNSPNQLAVRIGIHKNF